MHPLAIVMIINLVLLFIVGIMLIIFKHRMNKNEPAWGWKRKQFLEEKKSGVASAQNQPHNPTSKSELKRLKKEQQAQESILDLMELKDIGLGIVERERNEFLLIIETDFVNFDLLQVGERQAILEGYQQLYNTVNFPIQLLVQAVRQDFSKDKKRFEDNLSRCNEYVKRFNQSVMEYIADRAENEFRLTMNVYYIVKFHYEPSKLGKLNKEQRTNHIRNQIMMRANIVRAALRRARVEGRILETIEAAEVLKRPLNRERMLIHPIENIAENEKLVDVVTLDYTSIPEFAALVHDVEGALELVNS